jgi:hypothetical protein
MRAYSRKVGRTRSMARHRRRWHPIPRTRRAVRRPVREDLCPVECVARRHLVVRPCRTTRLRPIISTSRSTLSTAIRIPTTFSAVESARKRVGRAGLAMRRPDKRTRWRGGRGGGRDGMPGGRRSWLLSARTVCKRGYMRWSLEQWVQVRATCPHPGMRRWIRTVSVQGRCACLIIERALMFSCSHGFQAMLMAYLPTCRPTSSQERLKSESCLISYRTSPGLNRSCSSATPNPIRCTTLNQRNHPSGTA